jgi:uncharacterized membrane protein
LKLGSRPHKRKERSLTNLLFLILGWVGAANLLLLSFYLFTTIEALSRFPNMEQLVLQGYAGAGLLVVAAMAAIIGSSLLQKGRRRTGGIVNLLAGSLVPIPVCYFFSFVSEPTLLEWLGPLAWILQAPTIMSGVAGVLLPHQ